MGLFGYKDAIAGAALGVGGAFDKDKKLMQEQSLVLQWGQVLVLARNGHLKIH